MRVTMCGSGAASALQRGGAAILVEAAGQSLLLDSGHSAINGVARAVAAGPGSIDAVLLSHLHFDHVVGLPELLCRFALERRGWPAVYGPRDTSAYAGQALGLARTLMGGPDRDLEEPPVVETYPGDEREFGPVHVRSVEVPHAPQLQCLARRLDVEGDSLVYSGDTTYAPEVMVPLAEGANLLIHECYTEEALEALVAGMQSRAQQDATRTAIRAVHTRADDVGRIAAEAGVGTLVLTHLLADEDEATLRQIVGAHFHGEIVVARDGLVLGG